jgi:hypothetical protein
MKKYKSEISGHLDIFVSHNEDVFEGKVQEWHEILIHGDPEGLKSFANLLIRIANLNQEKIESLPIGAREHIHLRPKLDLSNSSEEVIVGRIDAKGTGAFYDSYTPRDNEKKSKAVD